MTRDDLAEYIVLLIATIALLVCAIVGTSCSPVAHAVPPISESHSQITATTYDEVETAFSGGLAPMPADWADAECQRLLERRDTASAVVLGLVGLTGAGGVATLVPKEASESERRGWDLGLGIATLAAATTATVLGALVKSWSADYETRCITETPSPPEHPASDELEPAHDADGGME